MESDGKDQNEKKESEALSEDIFSPEKYIAQLEKEIEEAIIALDI